MPRSVRWLLVAMSLCLGGCAGAGSQGSGETTLERCPTPRSEVCAQIYAPVCATTDAGQHGDWKTFSNACMACSRADTSGFVPGPCAQR